MALADYLTAQYLRKRAGGQSYQRGMEYYRQGRVRLEDVTPARIRARVLGTKLYWVNLWESCTCKMPIRCEELCYVLYVFKWKMSIWFNVEKKWLTRGVVLLT